MKVLLIGPTFFGYRDRVAAEMMTMGYKVEVVDDRPSESVAFRSAVKLGHHLVDRAISSYAKELAGRVRVGCFDLVVYMGGMSFPFTNSQFEAVRSASDAHFTAYLWDSLANCERFAGCMGMFDRVLSFEPRDCCEHSLELRPLFYGEEYASVPVDPQGGFDYDACFIGSVHQPSKFEAVKVILDGLEGRGLRVFKHLYMPSSSAELLRRVTHRSYRSVEFSHAIFDAGEVAGVYGRSHAVIDSPQAEQRGLTMRTLEVLGAGRKLITTNTDIESYDFYNPANVFVSRGGSLPSLSFFESSYIPVPSNVLNRYSIHGFTLSLLGEDPSFHDYRKARA